MLNYKEFIKEKKVSHIVHNKEYEIYICFENEPYSLRLYANADCCSESWFEKLNTDFDYLIGKEIIDICKSDEPIELEESHRQEYTQNDIIRISLSDETFFDFVLRNASNGYYSGWLDINVQTCNIVMCEE